MRAADWVQETTTSIAGTSGNGAVTLSSVTGRPRFSTVFGTGAVNVRYVIRQTSSNKREEGVGSVSSNVLTRTRPQVTWDGTTWTDKVPSALQFGSTPTTGDTLIEMAPVMEHAQQAMVGRNLTLTGDGLLDFFPQSGHLATYSNGSACAALTSGTEFYHAYRMDSSGWLKGVRFYVAAAGTSLKMALYSMDYTGLPAQKIVDFNVMNVSSTGVVADTTNSTWTPANGVWVPSGWYAIGAISNNSSLQFLGIAATIAGTNSTPWGRQGGYGYAGLINANTGNYTTGLPAVPNLGAATLVNPLNGVAWLGLQVAA